MKIGWNLYSLQLKARQNENLITLLSG